jgi:hypothetical protein
MMFWFHKDVTSTALPVARFEGFLYTGVCLTAQLTVAAGAENTACWVLHFEPGRTGKARDWLENGSLGREKPCFF